MKRVIEKLVGQLGLAEGATEDVILEKMQGVPTPAAVAELQNSLKVATEERDALRVQVKGVEQEIVNRHLSEFDGIVTEKTKGFWGEQLLANREKALVALGDLKQVAQSGKGEAEGARREEAGQTKKPLHNRATARPVIPGQGAAVGAEGDGKAVKIRNRAHEIAKSEKVPFSAAFRRAEREVCGGQ